MAFVTLRVLDGPDRGRVFSELLTPISIGREEGNTVQLNDERVSRFHLKIQEDQEKIVLTDLESTNGTKVNGDDTHLKILRFGDVICVGRSVMLFGSQEQIAERLAALRGADLHNTGTMGEQPGENPNANLDFELNWSEDNGESPRRERSAEPPDLPKRLTPGQAAELAELLDYVHRRLRDLTTSGRVDEKSKKVQIDERKWQAALDMQSRLALYIRKVSLPREDN